MRKLAAAALFILIVVALAGFVHADPVTIRILHVNDFHGFAEPYTPYGAASPRGGVAWLAAKAQKLRTERPSLLLAAGDMIQGGNWANLSRGKSSIELMNLMKFDAMVVGNHELDFGQKVLSERVGEASFPVLGANVSGINILSHSLVRDIGGVSVAIVGVVTDDTPVSTNPRNVTGLRFFPAVEILAREIPELRQQADVIIVLSHVGYAADRMLAEQVPGIDLIVGGHSHTRLEQPTRIGKTVIVQAWEHAKALGVVDITVDSGSVAAIEGRLVDIMPDQGEPDPDIRFLVDKYRKEVDAVLGDKVGETAVPLDGSTARTAESNLADLVADIMRTTAGADAAIINGGGIRASIAAGPILMKDVYDVLPFDNYIVAIRLTGLQIRQSLEHGLSGIDNRTGAFPQVSGLSFSYDSSAPSGSRLREIMIDGRPLDLQKEYVIATNDFLAAGGDGYTAFGDAVRSSSDFALVGGTLQGEKLVYCDSSRWLRDVVSDWLREKGRIAPSVDGRIKVLN